MRILATLDSQGVLSKYRYLATIALRLHQEPFYLDDRHCAQEFIVPGQSEKAVCGEGARQSQYTAARSPV